jgi:hypothetical protein
LLQEWKEIYEYKRDTNHIVDYQNDIETNERLLSSMPVGIATLLKRATKTREEEYARKTAAKKQKTGNSRNQGGAVAASASHGTASTIGLPHA